MIGMRVPKALFEDGYYVDVIITGVELPKNYREAKAKEYQTSVQKAEVLGLPTPPQPEMSFKEGGLAVNWAIIAVGENAPTERLFLRNQAGGVTVPNGIASGTMIQLSLSEVFNKSEELRMKGKPYGYNFQRTGVVRAGVKNGELAMVCGYLHSNPNSAKDWNEKITAYEVSRDDEKYKALIQEEDERLAAWKHDVDLWHQLSEEEAKAELLEGVARRLGLFRIVSERSAQYIEPTIGATFTCKVKVGDKGYPELITLEKRDSEKFYRCITTNAKPPMGEEDVEYAQEIALAIERKAMTKQTTMFPAEPVVEPEADAPF